MQTSAHTLPNIAAVDAVHEGNEARYISRYIYDRYSPSNERALDVTPDLLRFSTGIESADDLIADVLQAMS